MSNQLDRPQGRRTPRPSPLYPLALGPGLLGLLVAFGPPPEYPEISPAPSDDMRLAWAVMSVVAMVCAAWAIRLADRQRLLTAWAMVLLGLGCVGLVRAFVTHSYPSGG